LAFLSFNYERTWWRFFGFPIFWLWAYLMKVFWLSYLLTMSVPDEGLLASLSFDYERTWWRFFIKYIVRTKLDIYILLTWNWQISNETQT
jgi:hypothetical protein